MVMTKTTHHKKEFTLLSQLLKSFFTTLQQNSDHLELLLYKYKELRKEHINLIKNDEILGLLQVKGEGTISDTISQQRLGILLEKLIESFRRDQEESYKILEKSLLKDLVGKFSKDNLLQGIDEISNLTGSLNQLNKERNRLAKDLNNSKATLSEVMEENKKLQKENESLQIKIKKDKKRLQNELQEENERLQSELREESGRLLTELQEENERLKSKLNTLHQESKKYKNVKPIVHDYQTIIKEVKKALEAWEGKQGNDLWRLKVFYNKVAALTHSSWDYPGIPKQPHFAPKTKQVKRFLESL